MLSFIWILLMSHAHSDGAKVIATFDGGVITLDELRLHLENLPDGQGRIPDEAKQSESKLKFWLKTRLDGLAWQKIMDLSPKVNEVLASPEFVARVTWSHVNYLANLVGAELKQDVKPSQAQIDRVLNQLVDPNLETQFSFRHIYLKALSDSKEQEKMVTLAKELCRRFRQGEDFSQLAHKYSESSSASSGGLSQHIKAKTLDAKVKDILFKLDLNDISDPVVTRTGIHIVQLLKKKLPTDDFETLESSAIQRVELDELKERMTALMEKLQSDNPVDLSRLPCRIGPWQITKETLPYYLELTNQGGVIDSGLIRDGFLMATEASRRGLDKPEVLAKVELSHRQLARKIAFEQQCRAYVETLPLEVKNAFYASNPKRFLTPEQFHVDLIFIPIGQDAFADQLEFEQLTTRLRAGLDFEQTAKKLSHGPEAERGGHLGNLTIEGITALHPALGHIAPEMGAGDISDPIYCGEGNLLAGQPKLTGGYAIILIKERLQPRKLEFSEADGLLVEAYLGEHIQSIGPEVFLKTLVDKNFQINEIPALGEIVL